MMSWWVGDLFGVLLFTPLIVITLQKRLQGTNVNFKKRMMVVVPVAISLCIFTFWFNYLRNEMIKDSYKNYVSETTKITNLFKRELSVNLSNVMALGAFFDASDYVSAEEYKIFTREILENSSVIYGFSWIPKIQNENRMSFVQSIREQVFEHFTIKRRDKKGGLIEESVRDYYFPISYIEPYEFNKMVHGYDVSKVIKSMENSHRVKVLDYARDTGQIRATRGFPMVLREGQYGFITYFPLYSDQDIQDLSERRAKHVGYVGGIFVIPTLVQSLAEQAHDLASAIILSEVNNGNYRVLYDSRTPDFKEGVSDSYIFQGLDHVDYDLHVAGENWVLTFVRKSGSIVSEQIFTLEIYVLTGASFSMFLMVFLITIVSRNEHIESLVQEKTESISQVNKQLKLAEETADIGHWHFDVQNNDLYWSDHVYEIHGVDKQKFTPNLEMAIDFYHEEDRSGVEKIVNDSIEERSEFEFEKRIVKPSNEIVHIYSKGMVNLDEHGDVISIFGIVQNITQRKKFEEEIRLKTDIANQNSKLAVLGEIAAGVAHEVNNPLGIISGNAEIIKKLLSVQKYEQIDKVADKIKHSVDRISHIVNGLKKFSRAPEVEKIKEDISDVILEAAELVEHLIKQNNVKLEIECDESIDVICNRNQIQQVIINLVNNSVYAISDLPHRWIKISANHNGEKVIIQVKDSGTGIDDKQSNSLFVPFQTTKPVGDGTGLGLSISHGIIKDHGGMIYYDSTEVNTTFVIELDQS